MHQVEMRIGTDYSDRHGSQQYGGERTLLYKKEIKSILESGTPSYGMFLIVARSKLSVSLNKSKKAIYF